MTQKERNAFLTAIKKKEGEGFVSIVKQHKSNLSEFFQAFSQKDVSEIFSAVNEILIQVIESKAFFPKEVYEDPTDYDPKKQTLSLHIIESVVSLVDSFIAEKKRKGPDSLLDLASNLHGIHLKFSNDLQDLMIPLQTVEKCDVPNQIAHICETWWHQDRPGKEHLTPQTISYLLVRVLEDNRVVDAQRLYNFRAAFLIIDFGDESSITLKRLLLRCMIHPVFLRNKKLRPFLVYLFGLHVPFIDELHATIKGQLPLAHKSILEAYGEIYFKAWKGASGPYLLKIETCIQELMFIGIHAAKAQISSAIQKVLAEIHSKKKTKGVDAMLLNLYGPILWRSLSAANPIVRKNAATLLIDSFPLQNPESPQREIDEILQKQFNLLEHLLRDPAVGVRCVAVAGVCRILSVYWELIPDAIIRGLISILVNDLANDIASNQVRVAVVEGIQYLLDNHLSHPLLKALLPKLSPMIHDTAERVRIAFIELLTFVRSIKLIKFYEIIPVEELLLRLSTDSSAVCKKLTSLLLNSYLPHTKANAIQVKRCIVLIKANKDAAKAFYGQAHLVAPLSAIVKLIGLLYKAVSKCIARGDKEAEDEEGNKKEFLLKPTDTDIMSTMLELAAIMWEKITSELGKSENEALNKYLLDTVTDSSLRQNMAFFATSNISNKTLYQLASHLPKDKISVFSTSCLAKLKQLQSDNSGDWEALMSCVFSWNCGGQVLDMIQGWLETPFSDSENSNSKKKSKKNKKSTLENSSENSQEESQNPEVTLGLRLLNALLAEQSTRLGMLTYSQQTIQLMKTLLQYFVLVQKKMYNENSVSLESEILLSALATYCKLFIHITASFSELEKDTDPLKELVQWVEEIVVPAISSTSDTDASEDESISRKRKSTTPGNMKFVISVAEVTTRMMAECMTFGLCSTSLTKQIVSIIDNLVSTNNPKLLDKISPIVYKVIYQLYNWTEDSMADSLFKKIIESDEEHLTGAAKEVKLGEILSLHQKNRTLPAFLSDLMSGILDSIEIPDDTSNLHTTFDDFKNSSSFVLGTLQRSSVFLKALAAYMNGYVASNNSAPEAVWRTLDLVSVLVTCKPSNNKKPDLSALQNYLISLISKLPEEGNSSFASGTLKTLANNLLQQSMGVNAH